MRWIQHLDLKNKLILLAAISGAMALVMACSGFVWHDLRLIKSAQINELQTKAEMLAITTACAISQDHPKALQTLIEALKTHTTIETVCVFNSRGEPIASSPTITARSVPVNLPVGQSIHRYTNAGELEFFYPIIDRGNNIGIVYLKANMGEYYDQVRSHATMIFVVTLCSLAVALVFGSMMQSLISIPILQLADAAQKITMDDDYTIRVTTDSRDELGILFDSFNRMVEKIQSSQAELKEARDEMEANVEHRTSQLLIEIVQRETIQQELVRAKEAAEMANNAKSRFLANMSHEIRTPLNSILGFTDYVLKHDRGILEEDRRDYLRTIKKSGENLLVLINDILDLSKIEAEKMDFERIRFSPHNIIAEVISILRPKAREKNLSLEYRWDGVVPDSIESDPLRFRQLLMNLIGNAVKFSEVGGVEVVARVDRATRTLFIDVIDTGVGIPLDTQRALFSPFTQGDSSVTRRFGGTGLGLSICKSIIKGLEGRIHFKSEVGKGSTFSFAINTGELESIGFSSCPLEDIVAEQAVVHPTESLQHKRILIAEDGETNRKLMKLLLQQTGAEIVLVENGMEAVVAARNSVFDLILLDMQMPVMDGYSAASQLRADGFTKPIVALTAHAMRGDENRCLEAGCSEYMTKPIRQEILLTRIYSLITGNEWEAGEQSVALTSHQSGPLISELPISEKPFAELVCEFVDRAHEKLNELRVAQCANDSKQIAKLAHWMKGSGGMAGFPIVTEFARKLETAVGTADEKGIETSLSDLEYLIAQLQLPDLASM